MVERSRAPGYIRQRGDTWQVIVELDPDPLTGKRRRVYRTAKSERTAERLKSRLVTQAADGTAQGPEKRTVAELAQAWLAHIEANRSPSTMINYRTKVNGYIVPRLGKVRLDRLAAIQIDGLYATLRVSGGHEGKPLSAQTVRHVHAILHAMLAQARRWGWIARNPAEDASAPIPDSAEAKPPTPEVVALLHSGCTDRDLALTIWLAAVAGPRRGEICGLRWSDLTDSTLLVERSIVVAGGGELRVKSTKTRQSRTVTLDGFTVKMLATHRKQSDARARACGEEVLTEGYIISESVDCSEPMHPDVLSKRFLRHTEKLGITCHLHLLRHFHDTYLLKGGIPVRVVAGRAGHDAQQVLARYGHFVDQSDLEASELLSKLLRKRP